MPGHFTHIYTARRVADVLASGEFTDWPDLGGGGDAVQGYDPQTCGAIMQNWEKFTAIGAIGPDLFFFSMDWNNKILEPLSDDIMLGLATYYFFDEAFENEWEPLLVILQDVDATMANLLRFVIQLQNIWDKFVAVWDKTIGPVVEVLGDLGDALTGGVLSAWKNLLVQLLNELEIVVAQDVTTWIDMWDHMNTKVAAGYSEESLLWSDMTHYRRTSATCQALVHQAELQRDGTEEGEQRFEQFLAFAMGWITHVGTDAIDHAFVNEQCGGPFRTHPTRHHVLENHIDAWNYSQSGEGGVIPTDAWGRTDDYPEFSSSALQFAVQLTPDNPRGEQRPSPLPEDPDERKEALDVDGEMPMWMAEAIVAALIEAFSDHPHPRIYQGTGYQNQIDQGKLTDVVRSVTGHGLDRPFQELLDAIAPPPSFEVPTGFPLPWEVATAYRLMSQIYRAFFNGGWQLPKPRRPEVIIFPPQSDFSNLFQPPDFSGVDTDNPIEAVCDVLVALVQWIVKEAAAVIKLLEDIAKMLISPWTFWIRLLLYEAALRTWDITTKVHDVMAHTGVLMPHAEARYDNGELKWPNEIDLPMISLGATIDGAFRQALEAAADVLGFVDIDQGPVVSHSVRDPRYPYDPVLQYHQDGSPPDLWEYLRPWAYPEFSELESNGTNTLTPTPTETYDPSKSDPNAPAVAYKPMRPGPYPEGTTPDQVFFRTDAGFNPEGRSRYESAQTPWQTDQINEELIGKARELGTSPLGDAVPFSAYLIGRLVNPTGYATQFNLDADRGYGYLTWDWIRGQEIGRTESGRPYRLPVAAPSLDPRWVNHQTDPMQLTYVDPPAPIIILLQGQPEPPDAAAGGAVVAPPEEQADSDGDGGTP